LTVYIALGEDPGQGDWQIESWYLDTEVVWTNKKEPHTEGQRKMLGEERKIEKVAL
jgi:hypothetical protein